MTQALSSSASLNLLSRWLLHPILGTALVLPGCFGSGLLLAKFQAPMSLWIMSCAVIIYLAWSATEALFLANLWLLGLFAFVVGVRPWPTAWSDFSAWADARQWAKVLLGMWLSQTTLLVLIATTTKGWQRQSTRRLAYWGMGLGCCLMLSLGYWSHLS